MAEEADRRARPEAATRWRLVLLVVGAGIVVAFQVGKAPAALPVLRQELGIDLVTAGWVISIFNLIGATVGLVAGAMADKFGHRRLILFGLSAVALGSALGGASPGTETLLASRTIEGFGFISIVVAAPALIVRVARPTDLRLAFGYWGTYMPIGTSAMVLVSPLFLQTIGWRGLWELNAALVLLFALGLAVATRDLQGRPQRPATTSPSLLRDVWRTLRAPGPLLLTLCFLTYTGSFIAVLGFLPTYLIEGRGIEPGLAAVVTAVAIGINAGGNLIAGWLLHRGARRWVLIAGASAIMAITAIGIYSAAVGDGFRFALCIAFSLGGGLLPASILGATADFAPRPDLIGTTNGLVMQGSNLGQMIGPPIVAAIVAGAGTWAVAPIYVVVASLLGIALAIMIGRLGTSA
jgi:MFS family permease